MTNHEGSHHEHFEELCAIAASGQISENEFIELQDHLRQCVSCRSAYADFVDLFHDKLPLAHPDVAGSAKLPGFFSDTSSYRDRFLARARMAGVAVSLEPSAGSVGRKLRSWFWPRLVSVRLVMTVAAVLLFTIGLLSYGLYESNLRYGRLVSEQAELTKELDRQRRAASIAPSLPPPEAVVPTVPLNPLDPKTEAELARERADRAAAEARSQSLDDQLAKVSTELDVLRLQNQQTTLSREELEKRLRDAEQATSAVRQDLQEIRQARSKDTLTIAAQDLEIRKMSEKLAEQAELLAQERDLLEASRDVRELMGSRGFHIADIYDVDSKGKDQQAFGRVFYNEEKSTLIIYAFDLNAGTRRNASFQVWGKREPAQAPTHSLGLFQIDDQKQNRWVLRSEDPRILSQIDSVFVTIEPPGGSARPTGRQFLYAYLDTNPK